VALGGVKAVPEFMCIFRDRARWLFLKKKATWPLRLRDMQLENCWSAPGEVLGRRAQAPPYGGHGWTAATVLWILLVRGVTDAATGKTIAWRASLVGREGISRRQGTGKRAIRSCEAYIGEFDEKTLCTRSGDAVLAKVDACMATGGCLGREGSGAVFSNSTRCFSKSARPAYAYSSLRVTSPLPNAGSG
jgi:hypothetical protein